MSSDKEVQCEDVDYEIFQEEIQKQTAEKFVKVAEKELKELDTSDALKYEADDSVERIVTPASDHPHIMEHPVNVLRVDKESMTSFTSEEKLEHEVNSGASHASDQLSVITPTAAVSRDASTQTHTDIYDEETTRKTRPTPDEHEVSLTTAKEIPIGVSVGKCVSSKSFENRETDVAKGFQDDSVIRENLFKQSYRHMIVKEDDKLYKGKQMTESGDSIVARNQRASEYNRNNQNTATGSTTQKGDGCKRKETEDTCRGTPKPNTGHERRNEVADVRKDSGDGSVGATCDEISTSNTKRSEETKHEFTKCDTVQHLSGAHGETVTCTSACQNILQNSHDEKETSERHSKDDLLGMQSSKESPAPDKSESLPTKPTCGGDASQLRGRKSENLTACFNDRFVNELLQDIHFPPGIRHARIELYVRKDPRERSTNGNERLNLATG